MQDQVEKVQIHEQVLRRQDQDPDLLVTALLPLHEGDAVNSGEGRINLEHHHQSHTQGASTHAAGGGGGGGGSGDVDDDNGRGGGDGAQGAQAGMTAGGEQRQGIGGKLYQHLLSSKLINQAEKIPSRYTTFPHGFSIPSQEFRDVGGGGGGDGGGGVRVRSAGQNEDLEEKDELFLEASSKRAVLDVSELDPFHPRRLTGETSTVWHIYFIPILIYQ
jgi:hypothetical protein